MQQWPNYRAVSVLWSVWSAPLQLRPVSVHDWRAELLDGCCAVGVMECVLTANRLCFVRQHVTRDAGEVCAVTAGGERYTDLVASNSKPSKPSHHLFINSNNIRNEVFSFVLIFSKCGQLNTNADIHNAPRCYVRQNIECILGRESLWKDILAMVD